jgi:hypothetical protein
MSDSNANQPMTHHPFDVRIQEHQIRRGAVTRAELNAHLDSLPDDADQAVESHVRFVPTWASRHGHRRRG